MPRTPRTERNDDEAGTYAEEIRDLGLSEAGRLLGRQEQGGRGRSADEQANGMRLCRDPYERSEDV